MLQLAQAIAQYRASKQATHHQVRPCAQCLGSCASPAQLLPTHSSLQHPGDNGTTPTAHKRQRADAVCRKASRPPETHKSTHKPTRHDSHTPNQHQERAVSSPATQPRRRSGRPAQTHNSVPSAASAVSHSASRRELKPAYADAPCVAHHQVLLPLMLAGALSSSARLTVILRPSTTLLCSDLITPSTTVPSANSQKP